jgi:hypothetical protein
MRQDEAGGLFFNSPRRREATTEGIKARARAASFAQSHVLEGIHDSRFAVSEAIVVEFVLIPFNCVGFDDRVVVLAVVIPAKPQQDISGGPWECLRQKLLARYFNNVDCHLCSRRWDLHKQQ